MRGHYRDSRAERLIALGDPLHYEVFEKPVPEPMGIDVRISKLQRASGG